MDNTISDEKSTKATATKQQHSTPGHLRLVKYQPESFAGIHPDMHLVIEFEDGKNIIGLKGDQGTRKTSTLNGLISILGGPIAANAINSKTKNKTQELVLQDKEDPNVKYVVRETKSQTTITRVDEGTTVGSRTEVKKPKEWLRKMLGPIGINPMVLKEMDGAKQIKWMRDLYPFTAEQLAQEADINNRYKTAFENRTKVNAAEKLHREELERSGYYKFVKDDKTFIATSEKIADKKLVDENETDEEALKQLFDEASKKNDRLLAAKTKLTTLAIQKTDKEIRIAELKKELELREAELKEIDTAIDGGNKFVEENEGASEELQKVQEQMFQIGTIKLKENNLKAADAKLVEYEKVSAEQIRLNTYLDEMIKLKKQFVQMFTPEIEGLELVVKTGIDNEREEGIYYHGHPPVDLSESELWDLFMKLGVHLGMQFLFIENISSLGSDAVDTINWLVENYGVTVFYSLMERGTKDIKISFEESIK